MNKIQEILGLELPAPSIDSAQIKLPGVEPWTEVAVEVGEGQQGAWTQQVPEDFHRPTKHGEIMQTSMGIYNQQKRHNSLNKQHFWCLSSKI